MRKRLENAVVVITGASSGIGRAAALGFARHGARLVLAARREGALRELERECGRHGATTLVVPTDVSKEREVQALAKRAIDAFGGIDVWVNNAAVTMFGRFEESPGDDYEQVIRTNLFGYIYGARVAIPQFRQQGSGVLINNASIVGAVAQPYTSAYGVSKWGIRGLAEGLRMELMDAPNIHVCTVLPASIDTPLFQHGANFSGRRVQPMQPVYPAERVAETIVALAQKPRREVTVGKAGIMLGLARKLLPGLAQRLMARRVARDHFQARPANVSHGNLFRPMRQGTAIDGGWRSGERRRGGTKKLLLALIVLGLPAAGWYLTLRSRRRAHAGIVRRASIMWPRSFWAGVPLIGWLSTRRKTQRPELAEASRSALAARRGGGLLVGVMDGLGRKGGGKRFATLGSPALAKQERLPVRQSARNRARQLWSRLPGTP